MKGRGTGCAPVCGRRGGPDTPAITQQVSFVRWVRQVTDVDETMFWQTIPNQMKQLALKFPQRGGKRTGRAEGVDGARSTTAPLRRAGPGAEQHLEPITASRTGIACALRADRTSSAPPRARPA